MFEKRTDLALEMREKARGGGSEPDGIKSEEYTRSGVDVTVIDILNSSGEKSLGKPCGRYITASLGAEWIKNTEWISKAADVLCELLIPLLPAEGDILVAGLGNRGITPDNLGPAAIDNIIVTRHLIESMPGEMTGMRSVCAISTGVLGLTGIETAEIIRGIILRARPSAVIAIDALAAQSSKRLCRTFQISTTGITPGSGAYNTRHELNEKTLGVPVIAIGVPTVIDSQTLIASAAEQCGLDEGVTALLLGQPGMLVTPKDIDVLIARSAKVIGYAINRALQGSMSVAEMEQFLA